MRKGWPFMAEPVLRDERPICFKRAPPTKGTRRAAISSKPRTSSCCYPERRATVRIYPLSRQIFPRRTPNKFSSCSRPSSSRAPNSLTSRRFRASAPRRRGMSRLVRGMHLSSCPPSGLRRWNFLPSTRCFKRATPERAAPRRRPSGFRPPLILPANSTASLRLAHPR